MGEYIPAGIKFGGKLKREHIEDLIDLCESFSLNPDCSDDDKIKLTEDDLKNPISNSSINYGNLDDINTFCDSIGLDYEQWFDSGPEWPPGLKRRVGTRYEECVCDESNNPMLSMAELRKIDNLATGLGNLLDLAKWWCTPLPPLEIVP